MAEGDIEKLLRLESKDFNEEVEVDRILKMHDKYERLLKVGEDDASDLINFIESKKVDLRIACALEVLGVNELDSVDGEYRRRSRLVHPDKAKHAEARRAFEQLKESHKLVGEHLEDVKKIVEDSGSIALFVKKVAESVERFRERAAREKKEKRKREEERRESWNKEREEKEEWEKGREKRVQNWRDFLNKKRKK